MPLAPIFFSINSALSLQFANPHMFIALLRCIRHCSKCEDSRYEQNSLCFKTFLFKRREVRKIGDMHSSHAMACTANTIRKDTQTSSGGAKEQKIEHYNSFLGKPQLNDKPHLTETPGSVNIQSQDTDENSRIVSISPNFKIWKESSIVQTGALPREKRKNKLSLIQQQRHPWDDLEQIKIYNDNYFYEKIPLSLFRKLTGTLFLHKFIEVL